MNKNQTTEFKPFRWKGPHRKFHCNLCGKEGLKTSAAAKAHVKKSHPDISPNGMVCEISHSDEIHPDLPEWVREELKSDTPPRSASQSVREGFSDKAWLDKIDNAILQSGIVPTCNDQYPAGMDRLECIEHLIKLVKKGQEPVTGEASPTNPNNSTPPPFHIQMMNDFEQAVRWDEMRGAGDPSLADGIHENYMRARQLFRIRLAILLHKEVMFEELYDELVR